MRFFPTDYRVAAAWPWLAGGLLIFLLLGFNRCNQVLPPIPQGETVTLTLSTWGGAQELATLRHQLVRFEEEHLRIRVHVSHIPESYLTKLHLLAVSNLLPDVMLMNSWQVPPFASHGLLEPIKLPTKEARTFFPTALKSLQVNGQLMAIPRDVSTLVVLVNTDVLRRFGVPYPSRHWTLEEMGRLNQKILQAQPKTPLSEKVYPLSFYREPPLYWLPWVWGNSGQLWDNHGCFNLHTPKATKALADYMRLTAQGHAPLRKDSARTTMTQLFLQQRLAFLVTGRWTVPLLREQARFNWGVWPLPAGQAGSTTGVDATGYVIAKVSQHQREARELVDFLTSERVLYAQATSGLLVAARSSVAKKTLANEPAFYRVVRKSIATGQPTPSHAQWPEVEAALAQALEPYWDTEATPEQLSTALQPLAQRFCHNTHGGFSS
ncbi:MAG: sugar ABC transporter substrate-binding protein [Vampirovibrionales bacterium]|nr:sugar ABC transporter substrate-binding protein [Vampirovibrionales bacterium]